MDIDVREPAARVCARSRTAGGAMTTRRNGVRQPLATRLLLAATVFAGSAALAGEMPGAELCKRLTADEMTAVVGSARSAKAEELRCTYDHEGRPAIRHMNSTSATREDF